MLAASNGAGAGKAESPGYLLMLLTPALLVIMILFGGGLLLGLLQALGYQFSGQDVTFTLVHFSNVVNDPDLMSSLGLTGYIATTSTLAAVLVSIPLALLLNRLAQESKMINFILQIPLTVPHLVTAIAILLLLAPSGLISRCLLQLGFISSAHDFPLLIHDQYGVGLLLTYIWKEIPFITFMLLAVLKNTGTELHEVGKTLGASKTQRFLHITLPLIAPSVGAAALIVFAFTFGAFEVPYLLGETYPMALPVWAYKNYADVDLFARPEGIAIGLLIALIVIAAIFLAQGLAQLMNRNGAPR